MYAVGGQAPGGEAPTMSDEAQTEAERTRHVSLTNAQTRETITAIYWKEMNEADLVTGDDDKARKLEALRQRIQDERTPSGSVTLDLTPEEAEAIEDALWVRQFESTENGDDRKAKICQRAQNALEA